MKRTFLIAVLAVFCLNASAQTNHERTLKLIKLMGTDKNIAAMTDNMTGMFNQAMSKSTDPAKAKEMSAFMSNEIKNLVPKLMADMVPFYEKHFTGQELQKFINFYSTPEGQKLVNSAPLLQKEMLNSMMTKYLPQLQQRVAAKMQEINQK